MASDEKSFIGRVVGDPANPPDTRLLSGWLGDSGEKGYKRLYTDPELSSYVDIPDDAILHTEPIRDSQPAGGVFVWIKADAAVKQGGSAAGRAGRFLQGKVQQDFSTPERAGFRCVTQPPCGEPTGFTGECTKQPQVGGAWPCITALPICIAEPTGFTGKCTHQPWPNPTHYIGCTFLHCPTHDLTHIPHICNIVASGMPGCGGVEPPQGGAEQQAVGAAEAANAPTRLLGCGYTKTWGLCETNLLGCGFTNPPKCQPSVQIPCITQTETPRCGITRDANCFADLAFAGGGGGAGAVGAGGGGLAASAICATNIGCDITLFCHTRFQQLCFRTLLEPSCRRTRFDPICFPVASPFCPVTPGCPIGTIDQQFDPRARGIAGGGGGFAQFGAAAAAPAAVVATQSPCSAVDACPTRINGCQTVPPTQLCTQIPQGCPTWCGPDCQSQAPCTPVNCTQAGPGCRTVEIGFECTMLCPTNPGTNCPDTGMVCINNPNVDVNAVGAAQPAAGLNAQIPRSIFWQCAPTPATRCFICPPHKSPLPFHCPPQSPWFCTPPHSIGIACTIVQCGGPGGGGGGASAFDACPSGFCPPEGGGEQFFGAQQGAGAGAGVGQTGWHYCTWVGPQCHHNTAATVCTQLGCNSAVDACPTRICGGGGGEQFAAAAQQGANVGVGQTGWHYCTWVGPQCHHNTAATVCTQLGCNSAVDACPTRICGGGGAEQFGAAQPGAAAAAGGAGGAGGFGVTAWLDCTQFGPQCGQFFTLFEVRCQVIDPWQTRVGPQCFTVPPQCPRTVVGCPPPTPACPPTPWCPPPPTPLCPPHSRFAVCTQFGPQCGGGGGTILQQQQFVGAPAAAGGAAAQPAAGGGNPVITLLTFPVWQCHHSPLPWHCPPHSPLPWLCPPHSPFLFHCPPQTPLCPISVPINCPGPSAVDACPTRLCGGGGGLGGDPAGGAGGGGQFGAAGAFAAAPAAGGGIHPTIWTQIGPQCPPSHLLGCTHFQQQCHTRQFECTMFCTQFSPGCPHSVATVCTLTGPNCPHYTIGAPQCPPASGGFACPSPFCPPIDWGQQVDPGQAFAGVGAAQPAAAGGNAVITLLTYPLWQCHSPLPWHCPPKSPLPWHCPPHTPLPWQCGGPSPLCPVSVPINCPGPSAVDACPTRICGGGGGLGGDPFAGGGGAGGGQVGAAAAIGGGTHFFNCPTPATHCFICDPPTFSWDCGQFAARAGRVQSGFFCPTAVTCVMHMCPRPIFTMDGRCNPA